ncbi:MAG: adenylate/guanylate cyclase domain-containing protein, partial [Alphaproteobacteria bacterium]|nr:adenylate/guanylate cyclase domain-containing protein [Alphaproteobacteria bacterium]
VPHSRVRELDNAAAALAAAAAIAKALAADNARRDAEGIVTIAVRIGLHSGTVVVGNIGSRSRLNYTIVGDTVNVAARLEQLGKEIAATDDCVVLLSDAVRDACQPASPLVDCGAHALRGRAGTLRA